MTNSALLYIGTYTHPVSNLAPANGKGIYVYSLDLESGALSYLSEMHGIENPSYLAIDPTGHNLYAVSELWGGQVGTCTAYAIDRSTGALSYINKQSTLGSNPAQLVVEASNRYVLLTNYSEGKGAVMFPIRPDGGVAPASSSIEHDGPVSGHPHQDRSHAHCILPDPANKVAFVADLGLDRLYSYTLDLEDGKLIARDVEPLQLAPGAGPRHLVFRPDGKFAYLIEELSSTITALSYDSSTGLLQPIQTVSTLPVDYVGGNDGAAIQITPNGKYLYGSNRGHDSIAIFAVNEQSGNLVSVGHQSTKGKTPRDFAIDPTGTFLLAANQNSDTIVTFRINQATGELQDTGLIASVPTPVCLKMILV